MKYTGLKMLTPESLSRSLRVLSDRDSDLAQILKELGPPPMWSREPGFPTLVHIILEQQVSLASAKAAYDRLLVAVSPLTPEGFLGLDDATLKAVGFSRQKISYARGLAGSIVAGRLDLASLSVMDDESVRRELLKVKGVGNWTVDIYLLMALRRPDVWPSGDLALAVAVQNVKRLSSRPTQDELAIIGAEWTPWRSVAARILWHYYLNA
ncbi:MAG TPA: DNA-3-methyladenine glycosylase 2 family protein [Blastocatellia bacterium]|jgi:DNA-3-methyladenine glycosylase II|nr:DNA-3-methyladenine glycosylase 2 family protein [Blastocatellia bacterium]